MRLTAVIAVSMLAACTQPAIESYCNTTEDGVDCSFTNMGGKGSSCVEVTLVRRDGSGSITTDKPVCSGELDKMQTANAFGTFSGGQPGELCRNDEGDLDWQTCELEVRTVQ
jgi:hypothetical protein